MLGLDLVRGGFCGSEEKAPLRRGVLSEFREFVRFFESLSFPGSMSFVDAQTFSLP